MVTASLLCRNSIPWKSSVYYGHTLEITIVSFINIVKFWLSTIRFIKFRFHYNMSPYLIYKVCTISSALEAGLTVYINLYFSFSYKITIIWKHCIKLQPNSQSLLTSSVVDPVVKSKTKSLVFASSLLNTQQQGVRAKTCWPWISNNVSEWNDMSTRELLLVKLKSSLPKFYGRHHSFVDAMEYLCHTSPRICTTCRKHFPGICSFTTYYRVFI
jgi:hypothetical protein